jgi:hypothetical protein
MSEPKIPKELDAFVDKVLAYKPKPVSKVAKARKRKAKKIEKNSASDAAPRAGVDSP